jgi:linearmycin/streptolysin S transport system ATP-binding protein
METPAILEVRGAQKRFGDAVALDGIHLRVNRGEWVGLLGPNGAGKTTLVRAIAGRVRLDAGQITLAGAPWHRTHARRQFGLVPQENALYPFLTARENLEVFGRLHGLDGSTLGERVDWALDWTGLAERSDERTAGFSGGMKRRLNLACGVLHRPDLLLLDEPTTGVDPQSRERIFAMLAELRRSGTSLLHTTHQLGEAEGVCERVVIIDRGRIVAEGAPRELVERTLGRAQEVVVTLDRPPAVESLPAGVDAHGRTVRAGIEDLAVGLPTLLGRLHDAGYDVDDVRVVRPDLHAVFLHLTGRELRE